MGHLSGLLCASICILFGSLCNREDGYAWSKQDMFSYMRSAYNVLQDLPQKRKQEALMLSTPEGQSNDYCITVDHPVPQTPSTTVLNGRVQYSLGPSPLGPSGPSRSARSVESPSGPGPLGSLTVTRKTPYLSKCLRYRSSQRRNDYALTCECCARGLWLVCARREETRLCTSLASLYVRNRQTKIRPRFFQSWAASFRQEWACVGSWRVGWVELRVTIQSFLQFLKVTAQMLQVSLE